MKKIHEEIDKEILDKALDMTLKLWATRSREDMDEFWSLVDQMGMLSEKFHETVLECYYFLYTLPDDLLKTIREYEAIP